MISGERSAVRFRPLDMTYIALFAVLITICAWISIPMTVPFTLQTFAIFASLLILGGRRGTIAVGLYLLMGAVGLPVFAGFKGGLGILLGTTGGYVVGFFLCALLAWLVSALLGGHLWSEVLGCIVGLSACYAFGTAWFLALYTRTTGPMGLMTALGMCVFPFLIPDLVKLALAVLLSQRVKRFLK